MEPFDEHSEQLTRLLAGYVLGDLTSPEMIQMEQLLTHDPNLLAEVERLRSTLALLPLALPATSPPQSLEDRILQAAQVAPPPAESSPVPSIRLTRLRPWQWGGAIAALIIAALGLETARLHQQLAALQGENHQLQQQAAMTQATLDRIRQTELLKTRQELSRYQEAVNLLRQPNNRFLTLKSLSPKLQSSGSLVMAPTIGSAMLVLRDVSPLPTGHVYRLWALMDGEKIFCGDFKPNAHGDVLLQLPLEKWGGTTEVVVTVEPDQATQKPVGEMVITGS